jgi:methylmalonyl-CoA mutase
VVTYPEPKDANEIILRDLQRGVTALTLRFDQAVRNGLDADDSEAEGAVARDGIAAYSVDDLDLLMTEVQLDLVPLSLQAGAQFLPAAACLMALWKRRGVANDQALGAFNADPLGALAASGRLPVALDQALAAVGELAVYTAATYPQVAAVGVDTSPYHNAGSDDAYDLAAGMATAVAYLRAMTDAGLDIDAACRQISFTLPVGCDQFLSIAKVRAARKLWARVAEACGASEEARAMRLNVVSAMRMMTRRDPWVNILRTTVACFAGAVGGADSVTVLPYDVAFGETDELGRRLARNTQIILAEESNLAKTIDPGGGAWYIESRTDELARVAWTAFQGIERAGGMAASLADGSVAATIAASYADREKNLAKRKDPLTGVSEFPNIAETLPDHEQPDLAAIAKIATERLSTTRAGAHAESLVSALSASGNVAAVVDAAAAGASIGQLAKALAAASAAASSGPGASIDPLPTHRFSERFEALRDQADDHLAKTGKRPAIFLANLGPIAQHTARASFAKNFFEVGGIEGLTNTGFAEVDACVQAYKESGTTAAVICSADAIYAEMVPSLAPALKQAGCNYLLLAGHPGDKRDLYTSAGVDDFIFLGADVLATTQTTLRQLGVI